MFLDYYNLREDPFGVTPDPRYLYLSASHGEALASLSHGIGSRRGFMSLIAMPGMGKTTILFRLLSQLEGVARTVFLFQTFSTPAELLRALLRDLGVVVNDGADTGSMQEQLNSLLVAEARSGRRVVVVIDEAQNLQDSALELLRMLSNFETTSHKLIQIVLSGQPQLRQRLASPQLLQLKQRISIVARLDPLNAEETGLYMRHRLRVARFDFKTPLFAPKAEALIAKFSEGIPRNINNICFNALSLGFVMKQRSIREEVVRECLEDLELESTVVNGQRGKRTERELVGVVASGHIAAVREPLWRRLGAICIVLLLLSFSGRGGGRAKARGSSHDLSATSQVETVPSHSVVPGDHPSSGDPAVDRGRQSAEFTKSSSASNLSASPEASSNPGQLLREQPHHDAEQTGDPAKLWAEVRKQSSDAEVELARLYMQGTEVPRNCAQAQILLRAASRRGNVRAETLLSDQDGRCH